MTQNLITYDKKGNVENVQEVNTYIQIQKRHFAKGEFYMTSFDLDKLILEKDYSAPVMRVLVCLKLRLDFNNRIKGFRQTQLAEEAKTSQANVSRALKQLESDKIIFKDGVDWYFSDKFIKYAGTKK